MDVYLVHGTAKTPSILLDPKAGTLEMKGRCIPENTIEFFRKLLDAVEAFGKTNAKKFEITLQLEYFNTSSSKCLLDLFKNTEVLKNNGVEVLINWIYDKEDEEWLEVGKDYESMTEVPFKYIEVE
ncbi:MAG: DUF1987 domain-containing protein [Bacteroidota bacterium]